MKLTPLHIHMNEPIVYSGKEAVNIDYHHGQLRPAVGVASVQALRANRERPEEAGGSDWTYNHAPMLACHNGKLYLEYLSNPVEEHMPPGRTLLMISQDGLHWSEPAVIFPEYRIPDGIFQYDGVGLPDATYAVMHQRMGFYAGPDGTLLVLANYGISPHADQVPFGRFSIGRVVREIYPDDTFGPIYFIRYNVNTIWNESNTHYPLYTRSEDKAFVAACDALLSDSLLTQQWAEEQGDEDERITVKSKEGGAYDNKAFCWYRLDNGAVIGLWKWRKAAVSHDDGRTWSEVAETPTIKHAGAKIWGQRTSDGKYALVYNPHTNNKHRWPLAAVTGSDGLVFDTMLYVAGDVPPRRYAGAFKNCGFNYVRGIETNRGQGPDDALYVAYSVNKEDIWVSRIPVPIVGAVEDDVHDNFAKMQPDCWIPGWNIYSAKWAPVSVGSAPDGSGLCLKLEDCDRYDDAKAVRVFKEGTNVNVSFRFMAAQADHGEFEVELSDGRGHVPVKIAFTADGELCVFHGRKRLRAMKYEAGRWYDVEIAADTRRCVFHVAVDGKPLGGNQQYQGQTTTMQGWFFIADALSLERIAFRTGPARRTPNTDDWGDGADMPGAGEQARRAVYCVQRLDIVST